MSRRRVTSKRRVRRRDLLIFGLGGASALVAGGVTLSQAAQGTWVKGNDPVDQPETSPSPTPSPTPPAFDLASFDPQKLVSITQGGWHGWALMDRKTGKVIGSTTISETSRTCSMIKVWLASDYLRTTAEAGKTPSSSRLSAISRMIRNSENGPASDLFDEMGKVTFTRLKAMCKLTDFVPSTTWGACQMSPRDVCRMAACAADGTAAGPKWTEWVLNEMRNVKVGTWGIPAAFPAAARGSLAIKNGWDVTTATQERHMNCLAVTEKWSMTVMTRYPVSLAGDAHGQQICQSVADQLLKRGELGPLFA
ncbi:hypothetical protein Rhe02_80670 [Rhizocola hellebori]|uniref:Beta-lactamase n=1 Tax=Rhizocola hellebori TaxID=1392758 RepID=A0A8J3VKQ5_9ACTN|nr:hypothetical protein [Rhizocola hellebori]GIH10000.1 hypothetical protein Rhe02_80670 [Rhizocola hellebori]